MKRLAKASGLGLLGWFLWRLFGPDLAPHYRGTQRRPSMVPGRSVFVGRNEFFVREAGPSDAPVIVLVHGWSFDSEMTFFGLIPALADRYRVIAPDLRNHGKSDWIRGRFEIEDVADELAGVLDAFGVDQPFVMFGYSMGGMVAQAFVRRHPGRVRRLILGATAACPIPDRRVATRLLFWFARAVARASKKESAFFTYTLLIRQGILDPVFGRWIWEALLKRDPTLYYESGNAVWRFDARSWVGTLETPALVIIPAADAVVRASTQRELAELLIDSEVVELEGSGHEAILSRPDEFAAAIAEFADRP